MSDTTPTPARAAVDALWADDAAARDLGMVLEDVGPGTATVSMIVGPDLLNGYDVCHGGFIFTLAETALALAANTYGEPVDTQGCQIAFLAPGRRGARLVADARERHKAARSGIYDVSVRTETGEAIAEVRGYTRRAR